ncbi:hypothetical protein P7K49_005879 [Saguinus oedipus]|uniref:Uncharacterized protein n=1 Tax=Saguinus oedipus TaxID=9490 RepID=A0ABQ9W395_SAGOE|nr:hypothetical protein P7K49_005879 [Saguinus oedipus]
MLCSLPSASKQRAWPDGITLCAFQVWPSMPCHSLLSGRPDGAGHPLPPIILGPPSQLPLWMLRHLVLGEAGIKAGPPVGLLANQLLLLLSQRPWDFASGPCAGALLAEDSPPLGVPHASQKPSVQKPLALKAAP